MSLLGVVRRHTAGRALAVVGLLVAFAACGGDSSPTVTPTPAPTPPPPVVVLEESGSIPTCGENCTLVVFDLFTISSTGTIDVTVDYTHDETQLGVWIASGPCDFDQFVANQCPLIAMNFTGKPRKVSATGQPAGTYTLILGNGGPLDESVSVQVVFTAQSVAGTNPTASARAAAPSIGTDRLVPGGTLTH